MAREVLNNGDEAEIFRTKLNDNFDEIYGRSVSPENFGGVGDAETNDRQAIRDALSEPTRFFSTYATDNSLIPTSGQATFIQGNGPTTGLTRLTGGQSGTAYLLGGTGPVRVSDISITAPVDVTAGLFAFIVPPAANNVVLENVTIDGNVDVVDGARNWFFGIAHWTSDTTSGFTIDKCDITRTAYLFLKDNTAPANNSRIKITNSRLDEMVETPLLFNSPDAASSIVDIGVVNNSIGSVDSNSGTLKHRGTFAGNVQGGRVVANYFHGEGNEAWRMEEGAKYHTISLNIAKLTGEHGIETIYNDVDFTGTPGVTTFVGNVLAADVAATGYGLAFNETVDSQPALRSSVALGNILEGWDAGINWARGSETNVSAHNIVKDSPVGLRFNAPFLGQRETTLVDTPIPIETVRGGLTGAIHIRSEDNAIPSPITKFVQRASGSATTPTGIDRLTWETGRFTLATGIQTFDLFPLGYYIHCSATFIYTQESTSHRVSRGTLSWDGTTLTYTEALARGTGVVSASTPFVNNSGALAVRVNNTGGSGLANARMQVILDGCLMWEIVA